MLVSFFFNFLLFKLLLHIPEHKIFYINCAVPLRLFYLHSVSSNAVNNFEVIYSNSVIKGNVLLNKSQFFQQGCLKLDSNTLESLGQNTKLSMMAAINDNGNWQE